MDILKQKNKYGYCGVCGSDLEPIWYREYEVKHIKGGGSYKTGRTRKACSHLVCIGCGKRECVDDTFDGIFK